MRRRTPIRWTMLIGLSLALSLSLSVALNVVSISHQVSKPRPSRAALVANTYATVAHVLADVPGIQVARPFETGFTVYDINSAMTQFTDVMGIQWGPVRAATLNIRLANGQVVPLDLASVLSAQGPPYIELVQGVTGGGAGASPFMATPNSSPVHIGFAVHNLAADSDALVAAGFPRIATVNVPGQDAFVFALHQGPGNITIELFDAAFAPPGVCDTPGSPFCSSD
ncbi:MAG TPA: VOC family protein [Streptosporangiaceae bacterium]|nr:VOC family protein [Streptosporangiaceae bacterium]